MAKKLLNLVTNNIGLKLVSAVLAVILWLVVVNIDNPQITVSFTATATIINEDIITGNDKTFEILDNSNSIRFSVTGPRSKVEGMSVSDFTVTADMNKIDLALGLVPVDVVADRYASQVNISVKTANVRVSIEDVRTQQFAIITTTSGTPMEGYAEGEVTSDPATVTISGPESLIARIDKVVASVNIEGMYSDRTQTIVPTLYDQNGGKITGSNIQIEPSTVQVKAEILQTKDIAIEYEYNGSLVSGYSIASITCLPGSILVKGKKDALTGFDKIVIPEEAIDLSNATKAVEKKITISSYLPEGVELVDGDQNTVVIKVELNAAIQRTFDIPIGQIRELNLGDNLQVKYAMNSFKITIEGQRDLINAISAEDVIVELDFSGMHAGSFRLEAKVKGIDGVTNIVVPTITGTLEEIIPSVEEQEDPEG